jgi:FkbM family methyltransferase
VLSVLSRREAGVGQHDWKHLRFSYAQLGEDLIVEALLPEKTGFYVDVGAFRPIQLSNTYLFYRKGWRGIVIDAGPKTTSMFRGPRPRDIVVQCAVGETEGMVEFNVMDSAPTGYVSGAGVEMAKDKTPVKTVRVPCRRLDSILKEHLPNGQGIDFLSVDCEGGDLSVLRSNDWDRYRPRVIAVEDWQKESESEICRFLEARGYKLVITSKVSRIFSR